MITVWGKVHRTTDYLHLLRKMVTVKKTGITVPSLEHIPCKTDRAQDYLRKRLY